MDSKEKAEKFGQYLRSLRKERNMTLKELSHATNITIGHLSNIENGRRGIPSPDLLKKLAEPLGVNHSDLMVQAGHIEKSDIVDELKKLKESENLNFKSNITRSLKYILDVLSDGENFYGFGGSADEQLTLIQNYCKEHFGDDFVLTPTSLIDLFLKVDWSTVNKSKEEQGEFNSSVFELFNILEIWADYTQDHMNDLFYILDYEDVTFQGIQLNEVDRKVIKNFLNALFFDRINHITQQD